ncbi:hypothetical protein LSH36_2771g00003 [Paralvinella palmiformis]|uniref:CCHC-type domain-containing protein n=1 Tax=Paralvinella palmiformis TaxID=53620 RepID=A0AAD9IQV0_9ANNE|nr:hypothetical protein LSH36_2771g00003 [Paralvinella palmiformis]
MRNDLDEYTTSSLKLVNTGNDYDHKPVNKTDVTGIFGVEPYSQSMSPLESEKGFKAAFSELDKRYGDTDIIVNAFIKKGLNWHVIKNDSPKDLDVFAIFLSECLYAVQDLYSLKILEYTDSFKRILSKPPYSLHEKWRSIIDNKKSHGHKTCFSDLVEFVRREARKATDPSFGKDAMKTLLQQPLHNSFPKNRSKCSFVANMETIEESDVHTTTTMKCQADTNKTSAPPTCRFCKRSHSFDTCKQIAALPFLERTKYLKKSDLCFGCLRHGHHCPDCRRKSTCGRHPTILHVDGPISTRNVPSKPNNVASTVVNACYDLPSDNDQSSDCTVENIMAIIPVKVRIQGSTAVITSYAFMDPGSNVSFYALSLMYKLGIQDK